jgi:hypothetical protein
MINAIAAFDAHGSTGRKGWTDPSTGKAYRLDSGVRRVMDEWSCKTDADLEAAAISILRMSL